MEYIRGLCTSTMEGVAKINTATRTGAIDVVFVEQSDGAFASTPFHVRFGKLGVVWSGSKQVDLEINGIEVDLHMVLDDRGMAFFPEQEEQGDSDEEIKEQEQEEQLQEQEHVQEQGGGGLRKRDRLKGLLGKRSASSGDLSELEGEVGIRQEEGVRDFRSLQEARKATSDSSLSEQEVEGRNTLRQSWGELEELGLQLGRNTAVFSVTTKFQGTYRAECEIHVWQQQDRIVISDIDGTITRSDVRGMILPMIGAGNWAQGQVVSLYNLIAANGYRLLYLSARSISQAPDTKAYLDGLKQDGLSLPPGPLFLNPKSLLQAGKLEVIDRRPELFKIDCLGRLQALFARPTPFFAGYGNRPNDFIAYQAVGIPSSRIFLINKSGILSGQVGLNQQSSYSGHCSLVSLLFPPPSKTEELQLNYWEPPLPDLSPEDLLLQSPKS